MIRTLKDLKAWAKRNGHRIERWKTDDKSCYRVRLWVGTTHEVVSAQHFYWALYNIANSMIVNEPTLKFNIRDTGSAVIAYLIVDGFNPIKVYTGSHWSEVESACIKIANGIAVEFAYEENK